MPRRSSKRSAVPRALLNDLARYDSATVQNAAILVRGYVTATEEYTGPRLQCMTPRSGTTVGVAVTAELSPLSPVKNPASWNDYYDSIAYAGVPTIAVLKDVDQPAGRGAIMGDGMAYRHRALGCIGVVVDGNARDVPGIAAAKVALWATGRVPGHGPFNIVRHNIPLVAADLLIEPGDILVCDGDGITRVPVEIAADVAKKAAEVRKKEGEMHRYFAAPDFTLERYEAWKKRAG